MKRGVLINLFFIAGIAFSLFMASCNKENIENLTTDELMFKSLEHNPDYKKLKMSYKEKDIPIIVIELWKAEYNPAYNREECKKLGICHIYILGHQICKSSLVDTADGRVIAAPIIDSLNGRYLRLYYAQDVSMFPKDSLIFGVTHEFLADTTNGEFWFVPAGNYQYNPKIGKFGGYEIKLEKY